MTTRPDLIAERIASLPITAAERQQAQAYVAAGEGFRRRAALDRELVRNLAGAEARLPRPGFGPLTFSSSGPQRP